MAGFFWDTSALVKHYHPEVGTPEVDNLLQTPGSQHAISRLAVTETFSAFAGKVRAGLITLVEFDQLCRRFLADTRGKLFLVARLLVSRWCGRGTRRTCSADSDVSCRQLFGCQLNYADNPFVLAVVGKAGFGFHPTIWPWIGLDKEAGP